MTDKQVIIDGVDVSGCIFHSLTAMGYAGYNYCKCFECACECHNDCYYKQLKCKEQECEELSKNSIGFAKKCQKLELEIFHLKDKNNVLTRQLNQFKQTLADIKEVAKADFYHTCWETYARQLKQILQKISECEVE